MQTSSSNRWRTLGLALGGLVLGAAIGFAAVFGVVMMLPRGNFGEMRGVAAYSLALVAGAPIGALLFCALGVWWERKLSKRGKS